MIGIHLRALLLAAAAILGVGSGAAKADGPEPETGAPVKVYNWRDYIAPDTNPDFTRSTGIAVRYDTFESNAEVQDRLLKGATGYDVVVAAGAFDGGHLALFRKLDKTKLPNLAHLDPVVMRITEAFDPSHQYTVPYQWGTFGLGYNAAEIARRLPDAPVGSWAMVFDPKVVAHFADCGVAFVGSAKDVLRAALLYLGKDPNSENPDDYAAVDAMLGRIRPFIRYFDSDRYIGDIAQGDICLAMGWNGDIAIAQARADEAHNGVKLRYVIPREGSVLWADTLAIPADAQNIDGALQYINTLMDPAVAARDAAYTHYATPNRTALQRGLVDRDEADDPALYPPPEVMAKLVGEGPISMKRNRLLAESWAKLTATP